MIINVKIFKLRKFKMMDNRHLYNRYITIIQWNVIRFW